MKSITSASDNETLACPSNCVFDLSVYQLVLSNGGLQSVFRARAAKWSGGAVDFVGSVERVDFIDGKIVNAIQSGVTLAEAENPFTQIREKPAHLNSRALRDQLGTVESDVERRNLAVALEKKYIVVLLPLVIALFTAPFALSLSRKGNAAAVGFAVGLWLLFTGVSSLFEQLGLNGLLSPPLAVWSPLFLFTFFGLYLLSKLRT
jgi:lipopolysaccharide export system permease protein